MARKILERCDVCKRFHVWYVVEDPELGKRHLCTNCWKALYGESSRADTKDERGSTDSPKKNDQS